MKIYLSPSSQPHNAYSAGNTTEQVQCNRIADYAKTALERNGYEVKKDAEGTSNTAKVNSGNAWGADLYICIHTNAGGSSKGTMGLCYPGCVTNKYMQSVYQAVAETTPWADSGIVVRNDLYEINSTRMMCVYIECAFHDKADSAQWIIAHAKDLGEAIARGVCNADGKKFDGVGTSVQVPGTPLNNAGLYYRGQVQTYGWLDPVHDGQVAGTENHKKRLEGLKLDLRKLGPGAEIEVIAHVQGRGDVRYVITADTHATVIGSQGEGLRLEGISFRILKGLAGKHIRYRAHASKIGWGTWAQDGELCGSNNMKNGIEALQVVIE